IIVIGIGQCVMAIRDVFLAQIQKIERMDIVALSKAIIGIASFCSLGVIVWLTREMFWGIVSLHVSKVLIFLVWDVRLTSRIQRMQDTDDPSHKHAPGKIHFPTIVSLTWLAFPLGVSAWLVSLTFNIPRYFVAAYFDEAMLGYFGAIIALV